MANFGVITLCFIIGAVPRALRRLPNDAHAQRGHHRRRVAGVDLRERAQVRNALRQMTAGHFDPMTNEGGSLLQSKAIDPAAPEVVPADATIRTLRLTTPLFAPA